ncbi:tetraacyldisaccharide 4'-kinase [Fimbriiglobus ruber]|uniref:Tetraacyldisaccharide 4'-kinase n=1 Tax=Fimbriiglobus ruber TaxID=1908690 RepID=A0A225DP69_9BACT|nr:tetraacyldisaccharide 4'-kinase [Fimbriiglobus ruber]OWK43101.1 Tetraacyldisaccharide 4'-kinase [Fimbriiglobus ruber]
MPSFHDFYLSLVRGERRGVGAWALRAGLWWVRLPYGTAVWLRNRAFDRGWKPATRVPVPVVGVGNLTLGGTGKTPCVEYVAAFYRELGVAAAVLSRGYGAQAGMNDEAMVLEENLPDVPHLQGPDRAALARTAVEELESEVLVLDDGFQHRRLARDLDIVLVDATRPLASDYLFPRGLLREPVGELRRAGVIVLTRADQAGADSVARQRDWLGRRFPDTPVATAVHAPVELVGADGVVEPVESLRGKAVGAFCGIGNPEAFHRTLTDLGASVAAFRTFPDHHAYTREDVEDLRAWAGRLPPDATIATTQKDFVKLRVSELGGHVVRAVRVGMRFLDGEEAFRGRLREVVAKLPRGENEEDRSEREEGSD